MPHKVPEKPPFICILTLGFAVVITGAQLFDMLLPIAVFAAILDVSKLDLVVYPIGNDLEPSSIPYQSVLPPLSFKNSFPVIMLFALVPICTLKKFLVGTSLVFTWIKPPAHSPGNSGTNALLIIMLSII